MYDTEMTAENFEYYIETINFWLNKGRIDRAQDVINNAFSTGILTDKQEDILFKIEKDNK